MARNTQNGESEAANSFRFSLWGLIVFSLCLVVVAAFLGRWLSVGRLSPGRPEEFSFAEQQIPDPDHQDKDTFTRTGPWGELLTQNIRLERPVEYVAGEVREMQPVTWTFSGMNSAQVRALFTANGLTAEQADQALTAERLSTQGNRTLFKPSDEFILSLSPETRGQLYSAFLGKDVQTFFDYPYVFPKHSIETVYGSRRLHPDDVALLRKLVFRSGEATHLVDYSTLVLNIPTAERRIEMARALSRQSAVLVRLCVRPDSDIDKIAGYWGHMPNVRFTDLRPMLQSLTELPNGGTISLAFLLPPFARERLYTYPMPSGTNDAPMDCHWSTFNFSNVEPDNRFCDPAYTVRYIESGFYRIDAPTLYGDLILYTTSQNQIKHSAVYLADDLAFTKYGNNRTQPWLVVRTSDMQAQYPHLQATYWRKKSD